MPKKTEARVMEQYTLATNNFPITIRIYKEPEAFVPLYDVQIKHISENTERVLEKVREELINQVSIGMLEVPDVQSNEAIRKKFETTIFQLIDKYFIDLDQSTKQYLADYLIQKSLGLGVLEVLLADPNLEEVAVNNAKEAVWVYHKRHGWLKTNIVLKDEALVRHYASTIARNQGKQITLLQPMLDAHLPSGDRVNATLYPVSVKGNTITLRKFAVKPWTITDMLVNKTITPEAAALLWTAVQYEMSMIVCGGTASGKTSLLNVIATFIPPNQRIISIEDTRELQLPSFLHWVPMLTKLPNPEGKGEITMLDLLVNSLRQRPDRLIVGEIRKKREAEVLLEAIHTGHAVYGTFHANDVQEAITRLTNPPIELPKTLLPAVNLLVSQVRNRRTGSRRTFQIAEVLSDGSANILGQHNVKKDIFDLDISKSKVLAEELDKFVGISREELQKDLKEKAALLQSLVEHNINTVEDVGLIIAHYYADKQALMRRLGLK